MNFKELAELVPWLVSEKMEDTSSPEPVAGGTIHEETPNWSFRTGSVLTLATIFPKANELRLTCGLATNIPNSPELSHHVNYLNDKQLVFGRAFLVTYDDTGRAAVLMQEIVFGDGLSWEFPPSIQNLLRIMGTLCGQAGRLSADIVSRFEARPLNDTELTLLLVEA
ncbi:MAG: hypothetical protein ACLQI7_06230 [Streptosporangiaceae bacterium]